MPAVVLSPGVWLQIGLDGAQRPALRAMTPIRGIAYRAVFAAPVWQDRVNLSVASQHRLTQMQRLSAQPDHPNPVRRGCARPPGYMRSLLAWPRGVGLRRLSADHAPWGDWWLTRPTASGFMGMMPQSKGNWERKNPMRIVRCNADSHCCPHAHAEGPCLHYTCNNASESPWDSPITGIFPCPLCRAAQRQRLWPTAVHGTATRITQEGCTAAKNQCRCEPEAGIATCLRRGPPTQVSACCVVRWAPAACIASSNEPSRRSPGRLKSMAMGCTLGLGSRAPPVQAQDA